ncbi:MAG: hypothetical protein GKR77_05635 [Legionellales bacterium]|nr:hypothetical protein [Legionellales bacterium]
MKKLSYWVISVGLLICAWSASADQEALVLDQVIFQVSAEEWVKTETAVVHVNIDAALSETDLATMRTQIMENLVKIAQADWRITQFQRSQDRSGLEQLNVRAQARVPEAALTKLNSQAKAVSKAGATYRIDQVDFTPSLAEVEAVNTQVRQKIYTQINAEITQLNQDFSGKQYTVHQIDFVGVGLPGADTKQAREMQLSIQATPSVAVSNKVTLSATVAVAALRNP